jgi:hypothetical protein
MKRRIPLLVVAALLALALFTPTAIAQDDDDDDDDRAAARGALPRTGGPALIAPIAGALLVGGGVAGGIALRRSRDDS